MDSDFDKMISIKCYLVFFYTYKYDSKNFEWILKVDKPSRTSLGGKNIVFTGNTEKRERADGEWERKKE